MHFVSATINLQEVNQYMKKVLNAVLSMFLIFGTCGCAQEEPKTEEKQNETATEPVKEDAVKTEEDAVDDPTWDQLNSLGMVETENGLFYVSITLPADLVGESVTQESIDANAGTNYTSGKLNEDGSVTYKMTKKQHKAMLDDLTAQFEEALAEMENSEDYAIEKITHNADFTSFDVKLTTDEVGITESFMVLAFYMYGGIYSIFSGRQKDITVNYYNAAGEQIDTANSADVGE